MRFPGFIGPSYTLSSKNVDCQRCVNLYPEVDEMNSGKEKEVASLIGTPGLRLLQTIGTGPIRGSYEASNGDYYAVSLNKLYKVSSSWVAVELGTLSTKYGKVSFADDGTRLMIVDGTFGYFFTIASSTFAQITDTDFPGADVVRFLDSYFIFNIPGTQRFGWFEPTQADYDALNFASVEGSPDELVSIEVNNRDLWMFGTKSTEVFYDSGNDQPFERIQGAVIEIGLSARYSVAKLQNSVYWLGRDESGRGIVYRAQGYQPQRISTHAIELILSKSSDLSQATAWTYQDRGHAFFCLNVPGHDATLVFDATNNLWHERAYTNNGKLSRHRADCHTFAHNTHVVGDYENGKIYALEPEVYTDNGALITRMRAAPHFSSGLKRLFHGLFQLDMETGVGLDGTTQGTNPKVMLQWSEDGGHSWSNEHWADAGKIGEHLKRVIWRRLGSSRDRVYRVVITDPVKVALIGAELEVEQGSA